MIICIRVEAWFWVWIVGAGTADVGVWEGGHDDSVPPVDSLNIWLLMISSGERNLGAIGRRSGKLFSPDLVILLLQLQSQPQTSERSRYMSIV